MGFYDLEIDLEVKKTIRIRQFCGDTDKAFYDDYPQLLEGDVRELTIDDVVDAVIGTDDTKIECVKAWRIVPQEVSLEA